MDKNDAIELLTSEIESSGIGEESNFWGMFLTRARVAARLAIVDDLERGDDVAKACQEILSHLYGLYADGRFVSVQFECSDYEMWGVTEVAAAEAIGMMVDSGLVSNDGTGLAISLTGVLFHEERMDYNPYRKRIIVDYEPFLPTCFACDDNGDESHNIDEIRTNLLRAHESSVEHKIRPTDHYRILLQRFISLQDNHRTSLVKGLDVLPKQQCAIMSTLTLFIETFIACRERGLLAELWDKTDSAYLEEFYVANPIHDDVASK